ncbi:hypothetical protein 2200_scaffold2278_00072 [Bacteriophage sp.]|nr:hypothetical protein 2200_scaffold2278_00072 [Bacteriophage sp.]
MICEPTSCMTAPVFATLPRVELTFCSLETVPSTLDVTPAIGPVRLSIRFIMSDNRNTDSKLMLCLSPPNVWRRPCALNQGDRRRPATPRKPRRSPGRRCPPRAPGCTAPSQRSGGTRRGRSPQCRSPLKEPEGGNGGFPEARSPRSFPSPPRAALLEHLQICLLREAQHPEQLLADGERQGRELLKVGLEIRFAFRDHVVKEEGLEGLRRALGGSLDVPVIARRGGALEVELDRLLGLVVHLDRRADAVDLAVFLFHFLGAALARDFLLHVFHSVLSSCSRLS